MNELLLPQSNDPFQKPTVTVNYFDVDWDLDVQVATARLSRRAMEIPPMRYKEHQFLLLSLKLTRICYSDLRGTEGEISPGLAAVPDNDDGGSSADWEAWIQQTLGAVSHPIASAAMMRRDLGGVVDAQLIVYDTANVRVVDASMMPTQISAHLSSTLYGVAEKAADLIKAAQ